MCSKKYFLILIICLLSFAATGCQLLPGDNDDDNSGVAPVKVISTSILIPTTTGGNIKAGIRAAETIETLKSTSAKVTMTLSDGSVVDMVYDGVGKYTATISNLAFANSKGFVIEARQGSLLMQNMVTDLANENLENLQTDKLTTAFAQVALTAAKVFKTNNGITTKIDSIADLIKNVTDIKLDFTQTKKDVLDENNATYSKTRKVVELCLKKSDINTATNEAGQSMLEKVLGNDATAISELKEKLSQGEVTEFNESVTWNEEVTKAVEDGDIPVIKDPEQNPQPTAPTDQDKVKEAAQTFFKALMSHYVEKRALTAAETASLSAALDDDFLNLGATKVDVINGLSQANTDPESGNGTVDMNSIEQILTVIDANTYLVNLKFDFTETGKAKETIDSRNSGYTFSGKTPTEFTAKGLSTNFNEFPVLVRKQSDGSWKVWGNRAKLNYCEMHISFKRDQFGNTGTSMWLNLEDTESHRVKSGTISGGNITGTVMLGKNPGDDEWHIWDPDIDWNNGNKTTGYPFWTNGGNGTWPLTTLHSAGQIYTVSVTFNDDTTQNYKFTVPALPSGIAPYGENDVSIVLEDGKLKLNWPAMPANMDFAEYEIFVNTNDSRDIIYARFNDISKTSAEFPFSGTEGGKAYTMVPGQTYYVGFNAFCKNADFSMSYGGNFTVPQ